MKKALKIIEAEFVDKDEQIPFPACDNGWPEISTHTAQTPLPAFPLDAMPGITKAMTPEIAESVQIAPEVAGLALLIIAGTAAGRENVFQTKRGLDTRPNLFGLFFLPRGERKSSSYTPILSPVNHWISEQMADYRKELSRYWLKIKERDSIEARLTKADGKDKAGEQLKYESIQADIDTAKKNLRDPAFIADDATNEGLFELFDRTQGQIALATDDGRAIAKIIKGLYTGGESREELHLKGFDCKNPLIKHRAGKAGTIIEKPYESLLIMIQMDFLDKLAESEDLFQSGFMSRCLFCVPDSMAGAREYTEREISESVYRDYVKLILGLLNNNYSRKIGADKVFQLDPEAKALWITYYNTIEKAIGKGGELAGMADIAIRFPEFCRKFALLMPIVEGRDTITRGDMGRAIALTEYYRAHAERAFSVMRNISLPDESRRILKALRRNILEEFTLRDIERETGLTANEAETGINTLASRFYCRLKAEQPEPDGAGRKPSAVYESNPEILNYD